MAVQCALSTYVEQRRLQIAPNLLAHFRQLTVLWAGAAEIVIMTIQINKMV
jgi:hypothetical protein